jgi:signal transduction histidine kinase
METVRQLLLVYAGVTLINLALSAVFWARYRTGLHKNLFLVWASSILAGLLQSIPTASPLGMALSVLPVFLVSYSLATLIARVAGIPLYSRLYFIGLLVGATGTALLSRAQSPFWVLALPVSAAVSLPLLDAPFRALAGKGGTLTMSGKAAALSCIATALHYLDYPLLRDKPEFAALGFSISVLVLFAVSITAPAVVLERVAEERTKFAQINQFQRQFFANITHELRTPLTMIFAPLESMLRGDHGPLTPMQRSYLEASLRNAVRLLKLINDLLDLAKLEEGFLRLRVEPMDLRSLIEEIVSYSRPLAARKGLSLDLVVKNAPRELYADGEKLERVFVNLLSNALKFTDAGTVTITLDAQGGEARVAVEDTGIGIPPEQMRQLFQRFSQGDASITRRYGGTGIGLAYAKEIVELHGGRVAVDSTLGKGSRFTVVLKEGAGSIPEQVRDRRTATEANPELKRSEDQEPREWTRRLQRQKEYRFSEIGDVTERRLVERGSPPPRSIRVMLVEDNADILELINLQLRERYDVYVARNGREGLELAQRERPDVIVTDFMMPEMDGVTMLRALRDDERTRDIPAIVLTAKNQLDDRLLAREAGADIYLSKPFSPRELEAAILRLLEKQGRHVEHLIRAHVQGLEIVSAGLAHELQNPLNFIKNAHALIAENLEKVREALAGIEGRDPERTVRIDQAKQRIDRMVESAGRGIRRIEGVVALVRRYAREGYPSEPSDVSLDAAVAEVADLVAPKDLGCRVALDLRAGRHTVRCIAEELNQVIRGLLENAVDAAGPDGRVTVRTRAEAHQVILEISDNGPGIARESIPKIFSPFFTTKDGAGRGLGLAVVQTIVSRAGGSIEVSSVPHVETTFRVGFPAVYDQNESRSVPFQAGAQERVQAKAHHPDGPMMGRNRAEPR